MMIFSMLAIWLVAGIALAIAFGITTQRTNRLHDDEQLPKQLGAEVRYLRQDKSGRCQIAKSALMTPVRKHSLRRHAAA